MSLAEEAGALLLMFALFGSLIWFPVFITFLALYVSRMVAGFTVLAVFGAAYLLPRKAWPLIRPPASLRLLVLKYFSFKVVMPGPESFDPKTPYVFAGAPHGVYSFGDLVIATLAPLGQVNALGAPAVLSVPILGNFLGCCVGVIPCHKSSALRALTHNLRSIFVIPGGIAEIFENNSTSEVALIANRKGFVKLAIQTGSPLVPCYTFGNTDCLHCVAGPWLQRLSARLRVSITFFWGRWGLPIPFRIPLCFLMGEPIPVTKDPSPSQETIDKVHALFMERMQGLFEDHKEAYGWQHKSLLFK